MSLQLFTSKDGRFVAIKNPNPNSNESEIYSDNYGTSFVDISSLNGIPSSASIDSIVFSKDGTYQYITVSGSPVNETYYSDNYDGSFTLATTISGIIAVDDMGINTFAANGTSIVHQKSELATEIQVTVDNDGFFNLKSPTDDQALVRPFYNFQSGRKYIFNQSDSSNINKTLLIGTAVGIPYSTQTVMGHAGIRGAYTSFTAPLEFLTYYSEDYDEESRGPISFHFRSTVQEPSYRDDVVTFHIKNYTGNALNYSLTVQNGNNLIFNDTIVSFSNHSISGQIESSSQEYDIAYQITEDCCGEIIFTVSGENVDDVSKSVTIVEPYVINSQSHSTQYRGSSIDISFTVNKREGATYLWTSDDFSINDINFSDDFNIGNIRKLDNTPRNVSVSVTINEDISGTLLFTISGESTRYDLSYNVVVPYELKLHSGKIQVYYGDDPFQFQLTNRTRNPQPFTIHYDGSSSHISGSGGDISAETTETVDFSINSPYAEGTFTISFENYSTKVHVVNPHTLNLLSNANSFKTHTFEFTLTNRSREAANYDVTLSGGLSTTDFSGSSDFSGSVTKLSPGISGEVTSNLIFEVSGNNTGTFTLSYEGIEQVITVREPFTLTRVSALDVSNSDPIEFQVQNNMDISINYQIVVQGNGYSGTNTGVISSDPGQQQDLSFTVTSLSGGVFEFSISGGSGILGELTSYTRMNIEPKLTYAVTFDESESTPRFAIDGEDNNPEIIITEEGYYLFDLSDITMSGQSFQFKNADTNDNYDQLFTGGIPGTADGFIVLIATSDMGSLKYCNGDSSISGDFRFQATPDYIVTIARQPNSNKDVFAFEQLDGTVILQQDLSFNRDDDLLFDVADGSMAQYKLMFGTIIDDSGSDISGVNGAEVTYSGLAGTPGATVRLNLSSYTGDPVYYFEDSIAGMGYAIVASITSGKVYNPYTSANPTKPDQLNAASKVTVATKTLNNVHFGRQLRSSYHHGGWIGSRNSEWISLNLQETKRVLGVLIQPRYNPGWSFPEQYVKTLEIKVSTDFSYWTSMENSTTGKIWNTNISSSSSDQQGNTFLNNVNAWAMELYFKVPVNAQYVRLDISSYQSWPSLRYGVIYDHSDGEISDSEDIEPLGSNGNKIKNTRVYSPLPLNEITVTISGDPSKFFLNGTESGLYTFADTETYVFYQDASSNLGDQLVFGTAPDGINTILTELSGVTIVGTPGYPGAYTSVQGIAGTYFLFSYDNTGLGETVHSRTVTTRTQPDGNRVFAFVQDDNSIILQQNISISADIIYSFDVSSTDMSGYKMIFGTEVDNSGTNISDDPDTTVMYNGVAGSPNATITLFTTDASDIYYFDEIIPKMGYYDESHVTVDGSYNVSISGGVFYIDNQPQHNLSLRVGTKHLFRMHGINEYIVFGTEADVSSTIYEFDIMVNMSQPGQPGAYTLLTVPTIGDFYYFASDTSGMGGVITGTVDYIVKIARQPNSDEDVFAFEQPDGTLILQQDLSFNRDDDLLFDVTDVSMNLYKLMFGTIIDNSGSDISGENNAEVTYSGDAGTPGATVRLNLSNYTGDPVYYFEESRAGMGQYWVYISPTGISGKVYNPADLADQSTTSTSSSPVAAYDTLNDHDHQKLWADGVDGTGSWVGNSDNSWISLNLQSEKSVMGVLIQGRFEDNSHWVYDATNYPIPHRQFAKTLKISISTDFTNWTYMKNYISGEIWSTGIVAPVDSNVADPQGNVWNQYAWAMELYFKEPVNAQYVRLHPKTYHNALALRCGVIYDHTISGDTSNHGNNSIVHSNSSGNTRVYSPLTEVTVTISGYPSKFCLNGTESTQYEFESNKAYVFYQDTSSNLGNQLAFGTAIDTLLTESSGVTIVGTPGYPGAYTNVQGIGGLYDLFTYNSEGLIV